MGGGGSYICRLGFCNCSMLLLWLFLAVPWVCLQFGIVVLPDRTHLLFLTPVLGFNILNLEIWGGGAEK